MELKREPNKTTRYYFIPNEDFIYWERKKCINTEELKEHIATATNEYYSQTMLSSKDIEINRIAKTVHINSWGSAPLESPFLIGKYTNTSIRSKKKDINIQAKVKNNKTLKGGVINDTRVN